MGNLIKVRSGYTPATAAIAVAYIGHNGMSCSCVHKDAKI